MKGVEAIVVARRIRGGLEEASSLSTYRSDLRGHGSPRSVNAVSSSKDNACERVLIPRTACVTSIDIDSLYRNNCKESRMESDGSLKRVRAW